jgi:serine/threonine-protein kinase
MISAPQEAIGASFRGYHLLEFLGQGGTGVCYRVRHGSLGREACLKLTYPLIGVPQAIMAAVSRTVRALGAVDHPAIIKLRDFGVMDIEEDTTFYVCMDLVSNQTLASWAREKQPSFAEIMHVLAVVADALHAAHSCRFFDETGCEQVGILHGDIKPDNILMTRSGEPVITDFMMPDLHRMIAEDVNKLEFFRRNDDFSSRECVTSSFGTPHYMSPEQGVYGLLTVRSDVYSLGVTTFEAMLRYVPALAALFEPINDLISLMTSERPEDRPSSMEQVALRFRELARAAAR